MDENATLAVAKGAKDVADSVNVEQLIVSLVPDAYEQVASILASCAQFFAGGVLIAFLVWVIGFTVNAVFGWLDEWSRDKWEGG